MARGEAARARCCHLIVRFRQADRSDLLVSSARALNGTFATTCARLTVQGTWPRRLAAWHRYESFDDANAADRPDQTRQTQRPPPIRCREQGLQPDSFIVWKRHLAWRALNWPGAAGGA